MEPTTSSLFVHHKIVVDPKQTCSRLDKLLMARLPSVSRTRLQAGINQGCIVVNEKQIKPSYKVKPHDVIAVMLPTPPRTTDVLPEDIPLSIVYEDEALLIVNKLADMVVHPAHGNWTGTLVNALVHYFKQLPTQQGNEGRPGLVHRIDKGTSGLLVIAKTEESLAGLSKQFAHHTIQRKYHALVWGVPQKESGVICAPIKRSTHDRRVMVACKDVTKGAKTATTHYQVLEKLGYVTLVACTLETGRTHQIRAHMKYLGHSLFGDTRYGGDRLVQGPRFSKYKAFVENCFKLLPHQALHATSLGFMHPTTHKKMYFEVPVPDNFAQVIDRWTRYTAVKGIS